MQWCQISPSARILASTACKSAHICLRASVKALDRRPCFQCAATMCALPSAVRRPVDRPPCNRQRVLPLSGGFWQRVPRRVRAPRLWRECAGPKHGWVTLFRLLFTMMKSPPHLGFHFTPLLVAVRGLSGFLIWPKGKAALSLSDWFCLITPPPFKLLL